MSVKIFMMRSARTLSVLLATTFTLATGLAACGQGPSGSPPTTATPQVDLTTGHPPMATSRRLLARRDAAHLLRLKPAGDLIPAGARSLTAVLSHGLNPGERGHEPVKTTDPAKIAAIRAFINQLGVLSPGVRFCPADFGQYLTISFRKSAHARHFAFVVVDVAGCEVAQVHQFGRLIHPSLAGQGLVSFVEQELGFR